MSPVTKQTKPSSDVVLSVSVNAHAEGRLLRPTLRSISAALDRVADAGVTSELLIVLDTATEDTVREARSWLEPGRSRVPVRVIEVAHGDAGASRNAGAAAARGDFVAFCDGDDLVSSNYLLDGVRALQEATSPLIVHPATVVSFGARSAIWNVPATEDVDHLHLIRDNLWPSASISQRSTYIDHPYHSIPPDQGFGPEDWLWNIETSAARIPHRPIPDTMFFYRVRAYGGVNNSHGRSILPWFDIDSLRDALPARPHEILNAPKTTSKDHLRNLARIGYLIMRPAIRVVFSPLSQRNKERLYGFAVSIYRARRPAVATKPIPPKVIAHLKSASEIEPAISWTANGYATVPIWHTAEDQYSSLLLDIVDQLRPASRGIVAVPWVGIGGADLVSLNYARGLAATPHFRDNVTILATYLPERTLRHLVPPGVSFVQVSQGIRNLTPDQQRRILAQALLLVRPELVVSVNCFDVTNSLQLYGHQLASTMPIFLTLFAFDRIGEGYPVNPITDDSQRTYLDHVRGIITDNSVTAGIIREMLALEADRVRVQHQPALPEVPVFRPGTRAYNNRYFSELNPFRVVWPHRLDKEKRPESLIAIARLLREEGLPVEINVHGQQVLSKDGESLMTALADAGVKYRGPYSGGLAALPTHDYHALLLTSESEGLPLVLVQSMLLGLPVIATAVGGVTDIVKDGETGLLVSAPDDAKGFVRAIRTLLESLEERQRIIRTAYDFATEQHGWQHFTALVENLAD